MADVETTRPTLDDKQSASDDASVEKKGLDGAELSEDAVMAKEVEEFEERLQHDEAAPEEYLVQEAYEVAIKVRQRASRCAVAGSLTRLPSDRSCLRTTSRTSRR